MVTNCETCGVFHDDDRCLTLVEPYSAGDLYNRWGIAVRRDLARGDVSLVMRNPNHPSPLWYVGAGRWMPNYNARITWDGPDAEETARRHATGLLIGEA